ncbi:glycosyltransferase, partial [bacterium]|nr:glycosyltransferase [bacterium]
SQRILDFLNKDITVDQTRNAFKLCHEFGIRTAASVVVGVPTETEKDLTRTLELLKEIKPTITWYNVFVGIPDSELYQYVIDNKLYEFIDDRGLVYLKGHNERVRKFYGRAWDAELPVSLHQNDPAPPDIRVVMPVYNGDKYLKEAIESILQQTYQNFEFIVINDSSTDNTKEILKLYDDPRIMIINNSNNLGLTKSLNKGIKAAKGEYIARMDADDISLPHRFETQVKFLKNNSDYALVGSSYYQIDDREKIRSLIKVLTQNREIKEGLENQNWFGHGSVMMRKDAFHNVGGYHERYKYSQDYDLWLRMAENYKLANIEEPLYCWRSTSHCISQKNQI